MRISESSARRARVTAFALIGAAATGLAAPGALRAETVAILPVKLLDTSDEPQDQRAAHEARLDLFGEALAEELGGTIPVPSEAVAACEPQTTECLLDLARARGADRALFVVVQKSSTLILQVFATLVEAGDGELVASPNLNFRGDSDESWRRAGKFLARQLPRGEG